MSRNRHGFIHELPGPGQASLPSLAKPPTLSAYDDRTVSPGRAYVYEARQ